MGVKYLSHLANVTFKGKYKHMAVEVATPQGPQHLITIL